VTRLTFALITLALIIGLGIVLYLLRWSNRERKWYVYWD